MADSVKGVAVNEPDFCHVGGAGRRPMIRLELRRADLSESLLARVHSPRPVARAIHEQPPEMSAIIGRDPPRTLEGDAGCRRTRE